MIVKKKKQLYNVLILNNFVENKTWQIAGNGVSLCIKPGWISNL